MYNISFSISPAQVFCIILYVLGCFMTYCWWEEVSSKEDKNWMAAITITCWPLVAIMGIWYTIYDRLKR